MAVAVFLPKVGMTMEEGTLARWLAPDGAEVRAGQPIFELETEKVEMEVEAEADGYLRQLVPEDTTLKPGEVVGCILSGPVETVPHDILAMVQARDGEAGAIPDVGGNAPVAGDRSTAPVAAETDGRLRITPIARRLAAENGVDVAALKGSGPGGRIVEADVRAAIDALQPEASPDAARSLSGGSGRPGGPRDLPPPPAEAMPYRGRRKTIGERMLQSLQSMAQLTLTTDASVDDALKMMHGLNREWRRDGVVVTLTAIAVKAAALGLREHRLLNAVLTDEQIVPSPAINVGFAVDLEQGLMVPVIKNADTLPLKDVAAKVRDLSDRAKEGRLSLDDVSEGTFTVTSLETTVVDAFTPVINPPQAAILGIGRAREAARFENGAFVRDTRTALSLTFDHRVSDGGPAARYLGRVVELMERPYLLM